MPWSLKTQANASIRAEEIHISKFMELGKGKWEDEEDLVAMRERMFRHMEAYERIFSLRCLARREVQAATAYVYELVEIPKALLLEADGKSVLMKQTSGQTPKPGSCFVYDDASKRLKFELYFDGGTERKLQVRKLDKRFCRVHVTWALLILMWAGRTGDALQ